MDLNDVIGLANSAAGVDGKFNFMRWNKFMDNNKEFKRPDLWTLTMVKPAPAIYYPGDDLVNARMDNCDITRNSWNLKTGDVPTVRGYKPLGGQPNGFVDMSGNVKLSFVDKQDYAIELWIKSNRDLISHPETRFSYPVELLMSQMELAYYSTVQQKVKKLDLFNCVPSEASVGDEDPTTGDVSWSASYSISWNFPWHKETYLNLY